jgi:hypothetical protein
MNFRTETTTPAAPAGPSESAHACCLERATWQWAMDDIMLSAQDGRPIPTAAVDQLPPWRAVLYVSMALRAGGSLEQGDLEQLKAAAKAVTGYAPVGWWRAALGLEPTPPPEPRQAKGNYVPPAGWTVVQRPDNSGSF